MTGLAAALLAAGRSARFGAADKLAADFRAAPLGLHAASALEALDLSQRWVILRDLAHPCVDGWRASGFEPMVNAEADEGMGASLRLAARLAEDSDADALLVCLADMPLVTPAHLAALCDAWRQHGGIVASRDGALVSPPAVFARARFPALAALTGDRGAKALLGQATLVDSPPGTLADVDDPATLARLAG